MGYTGLHNILPNAPYLHPSLPHPPFLHHLPLQPDPIPTLHPRAGAMVSTRSAPFEVV